MKCPHTRREIARSILYIIIVFFAVAPAYADVAILPGVYLFAKDGAVYVHNERQSPTPVILIAVKFDTEEEWMATQLTSSNTHELPSPAFYSTANGATVFSDLLLEPNRETRLIPAEHLPGYYRIAAARGVFPGQRISTILDSIPEFRQSWIPAIFNATETVEEALTTASNVSALSALIAAGGATVDKSKVGVSLLQKIGENLQKIGENPSQLADVFQRVDYGPDGVLESIELSKQYMTDFYDYVQSLRNDDTVELPSTSQMIGNSIDAFCAFSSNTTDVNLEFT